jgi:predicted PhzF superfamily epimerase YddE/YHI9
VITARGSSHDFVSRYFAAGSGIPEDPVTGSIHATLVPYWAQKIGKNKLSAYQASARGGHLGCELKGDRVLLTGNAVTFMKAEIYIP